MKDLKLLGIAMVFALGAEGVFAQNVDVFVHGRSGNHCGTNSTDVNNYWGSASNLNSGNAKFFVGYDGATDPRQWGSCRAQSSLWRVLYANCRGDNECQIVCHSAGCYATDYFLSRYGWVTDTYDVNIKVVNAFASASGGSELANLAFWESNSMVAALKTGTARSFNHNINAGVPSFHAAGYDGWWYSSWLLPGEDDGAVAFHSACGKNSTGSYDDCKYDGAEWSNHYITTENHSGYSSSKQGYDRDHSTIKDAGRNILNR